MSPREAPLETKPSLSGPIPSGEGTLFSLQFGASVLSRWLYLPSETRCTCVSEAVITSRLVFIAVLFCLDQATAASILTVDSGKHILWACHPQRGGTRRG